MTYGRLRSFLYTITLPVHDAKSLHCRDHSATSRLAGPDEAAPAVGFIASAAAG
ncbi:hypothetical protein I553_2428 [Mycobacterium xenopi 4042]|uniref:Uncharacterized protein n=1 Tax=Mycobacterium xenopi 4042 TaxID=1299334 RepID=X8C7B4_MYCXE|nr:hypothetical protein I553_2428 [Mycobacterium xenopi 4042]